jgi:hypothetical protein
LEENSKPNVESEDDGGSGELTDASLGNGPEPEGHLHEQEVGYCSKVDTRTMNEKNQCRKAISGDRMSRNPEEESPQDHQDGIVKEELGGDKNVGPQSKEDVGLRRHGSDTDRNPKPSKRRRSAQDFSKLSYKYCSESFCGFNDRLPDGFYDAGRDRQFCSLDVLEKEQPSFHSREVILVDRYASEILDKTSCRIFQEFVGSVAISVVHPLITSEGSGFPFSRNAWMYEVPTEDILNHCNI